MVVMIRNSRQRAEEKERLAWQQAIVMRGDCVERLAPVYQNGLLNETLSLHDLKQIAFLNQFARGVILLKGKGGAGKTLTMTQLLYNLRKYFGMHVITDYPLKPAFGEHNYMSTDDFIEELKKIDEQVKSTKNRNKELSDAEVKDKYAVSADELLKKRGIVFDHAVIGWDEANRKLESSRANSKLVMMHRYYVQTWRHYQCSLILTTPEISDITYKALNQLTIELGCSYDSVRQEATAMGINRDTMHKVVMRTYMPNYAPYYNTHAPISIRDSIMGFGKLKL